MDDDLIERVAQILMQDTMQALTDYEVAEEIPRNDPELSSAANETARAVVALVLGEVKKVVDDHTPDRPLYQRVIGRRISTAIDALGLQQTDDEQPRCAECDCENGGADCTWIKTPDAWQEGWNEAIEAAAKVAREMADLYGPNGSEAAIRQLKKGPTDE